MNSTILAVLLGVAVTTISLAVFSILRLIFVGKEQDLSVRLKAFSDLQPDRVAEISTVVRNTDFSQIGFLNRLLKRQAIALNLTRLLEQANLKMKVGELVLLMLISGSLSLLFTLRTDSLLFVLFFFALFSYLPVVYVLFVRRNRIKQFEQQFPDALDMMNNAIRSGFALGKALQLVADETLEPISIEFRKTCEEMNLGIPVRDALNNLTQRLDSLDLKLFVMSLMIQRESGGNLTEILDKISTTIRARFKLIGQIRVFTAQGRFSGWILGTLPTALGFILFSLNPDYIKLLFNSPAGRLMIAIGIVMQIIGFFVIQRIVQIKVQ